MTHRLPGFPAPPKTLGLPVPAKRDLAGREALLLIHKAEDAAARAGAAAQPTPMIVGSPTTIFGSDIDPTKPTYYVPDGVCGFAGVRITPARGPLVRVLKATQRGHAAYGGGYYVPIHAFGQSLARKEAAAAAMAEVFRAAGYTAYPESRMD